MLTHFIINTLVHSLNHALSINIGILLIRCFWWFFIMHHILISKCYLLILILSSFIVIWDSSNLLWISSLNLLSLQNILRSIVMTFHILCLDHRWSISLMICKIFIFFCICIDYFLCLISIEGTTIVKFMILSISCEVHLVIYKFWSSSCILPSKDRFIGNSISIMTHCVWLLLISLS